VTFTALDRSVGGRAWTVSAVLPVSYDVRLSRGLFRPDNPDLAHHAFAGPSQRRLIVIEEKVVTLFGDQLLGYCDHHGLAPHLVEVTADEAVKDVDLSFHIAKAVDDFGIDRRNEPIIAIGGGVLLDVVGWVASLYRRGTPYIRIPTTLIGLVDAGVGIKTGVNYNGRKNLIGAYHPPMTALLDPVFLTTLPARHISNGLAEIAKMGLMCDARLWELLVQHAEELISSALGSLDAEHAEVGQEVVARAVQGMLAQLEPNLWERDLSRLVDFGHSFSPTLEMHLLPALLHGEAVTIDMAISCALSYGRGLLSAAELCATLRTFTRLGLPVTHPSCTISLLDKALRSTMRHRGGKQRLPVPVRPGSAIFIEDVTKPELAQALDILAEYTEPAHARH
jgi:3-dehydroquinate synthase